MAIGTSDGEYFADRFDYLTHSYQQEASEEDQGREAVPLYKGGKNVTPKEPVQPIPSAPNRDRRTEVDNDHHVPLIASGILDDQGNMTGMAVDHRVKVPEEYLPHLALHEGTEIPIMHDYMADGMSAQDAYHKAHDIATAVESASVRGHAARFGLDPDQYHDTYKQFFRDASVVAKEPSDRERHPAAHTTVHGLDEAELGQEFKVAGDVTELHPEFNKQQTHPLLEIDVLSGKMPQGVGIARGPKAAKKAEDIETSGRIANTDVLKSTGKSMQKLDWATLKQRQYLDETSRRTFDKEQSIGGRIPANENQIETAADKMLDLKDKQPDLYNYYRALYKQKGGKPWEDWMKIEKIINFVRPEPVKDPKYGYDQHGNPVISPKTIHRELNAIDSTKGKE